MTRRYRQRSRFHRRPSRIRILLAFLRIDSKRVSNRIPRKERTPYPPPSMCLWYRPKTPRAWIQVIDWKRLTIRVPLHQNFRLCLNPDRCSTSTTHRRWNSLTSSSRRLKDAKLSAMICPSNLCLHLPFTTLSSANADPRGDSKVITAAR